MVSGLRALRTVICITGESGSNKAEICDFCTAGMTPRVLGESESYGDSLASFFS